MSHFSFTSSTDIRDIFKTMFPDSAVAQKMNFGPTNYLTLSVLSFHHTLSNSYCGTERNTMFCHPFDESLNNEFHKEQMNIFVKYFNKDRVACRYLTSRFLVDTSAEDLKKEFEEGIQELDMKKMVQVSMDGPNVKWKFYDSIVE